MEYLNFFEPQTINIFIQLIVATTLGVVIGVERTIAHKNAGMRTYGLISLGAALFIIISREAVSMYSGFAGLNPMHIPSQVVLGIGFIGGGLIMVNGNTIRGITTAAGLWVAAGIGMAVGFELYSLACFVTFLTLFVFTILWRIEERVKMFSNSGKNECQIDEIGKVICKDE